MGEIADDMLDGTICSLCGCFFVDTEPDSDPESSAKLFSHGYPVVCLDCWAGLNKEDRKQHQRALRQTL